MTEPQDLALVGDVHGMYGHFASLVARDLMDVEHVIQLGDFGFLHLDQEDEYVPPPRPVYFIDGNHDAFPLLEGHEEPTEVRENLIYVPRGTVMELCGYRVGFLGGADSPDREMRTQGVSWFPEETIGYSDVQRLLGAGPVDLLLTHTPPGGVVQMMGFESPSPSDRAVQEAWSQLGYPPLVCGHMHKRRSFRKVEVLGELDVLRL